MTLRFSSWEFCVHCPALSLVPSGTYDEVRSAYTRYFSTYYQNFEGNVKFTASHSHNTQSNENYKADTYQYVYINDVYILILQ